MSPQPTTRLDSVPLRARIGYCYEYTTATPDDPPAVIVGHLARRGAIGADADLEAIAGVIADVRQYRQPDTTPATTDGNEGVGA